MISCPIVAASSSVGRPRLIDRPCRRLSATSARRSPNSPAWNVCVPNHRSTTSEVHRGHAGAAAERRGIPHRRGAGDALEEERQDPIAHHHVPPVRPEDPAAQPVRRIVHEAVHDLPGAGGRRVVDAEHLDRVAPDLPKRPEARREHRRAEHRRLEQRQPEPFLQARQQQRVGERVQVRHHPIRGDEAVPIRPGEIPAERRPARPLPAHGATSAAPRDIPRCGGCAGRAGR